MYVGRYTLYSAVWVYLQPRNLRSVGKELKGQFTRTQRVYNLGRQAKKIDT